jgi:WD40 repeat protein
MIRVLIVWAFITGMLQPPPNQSPLRLGNRGTLNRAAWSPDGKWIALSGSQGVALYASEQFTELPRMLPLPTEYREGTFCPLLQFTADSTSLAAWCGNALYRWAMESGELTWSRFGNSPGQAALSADGSRLAVAQGTQIALYDTQTNALLLTLTDHKTTVTGLAFSPDGNTLASVANRVTPPTAEDAVRLWSVKEGKVTARLTPFDTLNRPVTYPREATFSPDGKTLAVTGERRRGVALWDIATRTRQRILGDGLPIVYASFSSTSKGLLTLDQTQSLNAWNLTNGSVTTLAAGLRSLPTSVRPDQAVFNPDATRVLAILNCNGLDCADAGILVFKGRSVLLPRGEGHSAQIKGIAFRPQSDQIATLANDRTIRVWEIGTGKLLTTFSITFTEATFITYSPDGRWLAAGGREVNLTTGQTSGRVVLFDTKNGNRPYSIAATNPVSATFSPASDSLTITSQESTSRQTGTKWALQNPAIDLRTPIKTTSQLSPAPSTPINLDEWQPSPDGKWQVRRVYASVELRATASNVE